MQRPLSLPARLPLGLLIALGGCGGSAHEPPRNVLLIVVDTLRADHVGAYGYGAGTTPTLDRLAERSYVFEQAYAQSPWTKPSVASILTSLHAGQHRVLEEAVTNQLGEDFTTLAEVLHRAGWRTGAFVENPHIVAATGFDQGFETFEGPQDWLSDGWDADCVETVQAAIRWLSEVPADDPWFLYLHLLDPHDPYDGGDPPPVTVDPPPSEDVLKGRVLELLDPLDGDRPGRELSPGELEYLVALYDAEIRRMDGALADLLGALEGAGRGKDTLVLLTADHGEEFLEHGRFRHGYHLYEEALRIPLLLHVPGRPGGRVPESLVQHVDIAPTLLALSGLSIPHSFVGNVFLPPGGDPVGSGHVVSETAMRGLWRRSLRFGRWKLIRDELLDEAELYDLRADPAEEKDLSRTRPGVARDLAFLLGELRRPEALSDAPGAVEPEILRALERLGYSGGKNLPR